MKKSKSKTVIIQNELCIQATSFCDFKSFNNIVIYGAGQMGRDACACLVNSGINVKFFADKNPNLLGTKINGIPVKNPEEFSDKEKNEYIFAIALVTVSYNVISDYLKDLGCKNICFVGDLVTKFSTNDNISKTWRFTNPQEDEIEKINYAYEKYSDEESKKTLIQFMEWVTNNIEKKNYAPILKMDQKYFIPEVLEVLNENDIFISYDFLTDNPVQDLESKNIKFKKLYAITPIVGKYGSLKSENVKVFYLGLGNTNSEKYFVEAEGLAVKSRFIDKETNIKYPIKKLDDLISDKYTYLKIYGLGMALDVIKGSINSIKKNRAIVAITIHHTRKDFIEIPNFLIYNLSNYKFYLRLHSFCGFETIFYAIPQERMKKGSK